jgi:hypothetical protein
MVQFVSGQGYFRIEETIMSTEFNEVLIHLDETVDEDMLGNIEQDIRQGRASSRSATSRASST